MHPLSTDYYFFFKDISNFLPFFNSKYLSYVSSLKRGSPNLTCKYLKPINTVELIDLEFMSISRVSLKSKYWGPRSRFSLGNPGVQFLDGGGGWQGWHNVWKRPFNTNYHINLVFFWTFPVVHEKQNHSLKSGSCYGTTTWLDHWNNTVCLIRELKYNNSLV